MDLTYEQIDVGMSRSFRRTITARDVDVFAQLSGDTSPLHTNSLYASTAAGYQQRLVHGMHLASLVSCLVGIHLPGFRSVCLAQQFDFVNPVYADTEVEVYGEVASKHDSTRTIILRTRVTDANGKICVKGKATVRVLDTEPPRYA